ncbi:flagellar motor switch protein FliG [Tessaracoccus sp.]
MTPTTELTAEPAVDTAPRRLTLVGPSAASGLSGIQKAATFLAQMKPDQAGEIMSRLRESEVEAITTEVMRLKNLAQPEVDAVLDELHQVIRARTFVGQGGFDFAREMLSNGLGRERAAEIMSRLNVAFTETPFSSLRRADMRQVYTFLKDEHPQIIALVLAYMPATQSAEAIARLTPELQAEVAHRIAVMDRTSPDTIRLIEDELGRRMGSVLAHQDVLTVGGVQSLVEIINRSDRATERSIMEWLEGADPELAERVRSQMFVFEDIVNLDDLSIQTVLREIQMADLAVALKGVREDVREKVERNLSERAAQNLAEEIDLLGPVRLRTVEEAQAKVVQIVRSLEEAGTLTLSRGSDDEFVA